MCSQEEMATKAPTHTCFGEAYNILLQYLVHHFYHSYFDLYAFQSCGAAVTNLPYGVTEENLRDVFKEVGPIKSVR